MDCGCDCPSDVVDDHRRSVNGCRSGGDVGGDAIWKGLGYMTGYGNERASDDGVYPVSANAIFVYRGKDFECGFCGRDHEI